MTYSLYLGDRSYSSWSLRAWLLGEVFALPLEHRWVQFSRDETVAEQMPEMAPARTVPALRLPEGGVVADSLAIAEELASRFPNAGLWPTDPMLRALARDLSAEMHSSFGALRSECPMNLRVAYSDFTVSEGVAGDVARISEIWEHALAASGGPWLAGEYSVADAFYAPVATRIATYGLPVSGAAAAYVERHLEHLPFRRWRALGSVSGVELPWYAMPDLTTRPWPGPPPLPAKAVEAGPSENARCPYSGKEPHFFLECKGRVFGFCNATCRDKTLADPEAWPAFVNLLRGH